MVFSFVLRFSAFDLGTTEWYITPPGFDFGRRFVTNLDSKKLSAADRAAIIIRQHGGMIRMADALRLGISRNALYSMRDGGQLEQLARGLYRLADMPPLGSPDLVTVAQKVPRGVICLLSALAFHELTTQIPHEVWIAVPRNSEPPRLTYPPIRVVRLRDTAYRIGIEEHRCDNVDIRVYSREKTIVDCFCRRNEVGIDVVVESVKAYRTQRNQNVDLIMEFAKQLRAAAGIRPYLEALV